MSSTIKVYELARSLGVPTDEVLDTLASLGQPVLSRFSDLSAHQAAAVRDHVLDTVALPSGVAGSNGRRERQPERLPARPFPIQDAGASPAPLALQHLLAVVRAHLRLVIVLAFVTTIVAVLLASSAPTMHTADAVVLVRPLPSTNNEGVNMATEIELLGSDVIAQRVVGKLGLNVDPRDLSGRVNIDVPEGTEIIEVKYAHVSRMRAQEITQAYVDEYLTYREQLATSTISRTRTTLQSELEQLVIQLDEVDDRLAAQPDDAALRAQASVLATRIVERQVELATLAGAVDVGTVLQPATIEDGSGADLVSDVLVGLFAGLTLGVSVAFLRDRMTGRVHNVAEVERLLGAPVLMSIPRSGDAGTRSLVARDDAGSTAAEAYRLLGLSVAAGLRRHESQSVVLAGVRRGVGTSQTVSNLGVVLAGLGNQVTVVSADMRTPELDQTFELDGERGLAELLSGQLSVDQAARRTTVPGLSIVPVGAPESRSSSHFQSSRVDPVLESLRRKSDIVLVDAPPLAEASETLALAAQVGYVLIVLDRTTLTTSNLEFAARQFQQLDVALLGVVVHGTSLSGLGTGL